MKVPSDKPVNNEELPHLPKDFVDRVEKLLTTREKRDSLLVKRLGRYGASLAIRLLRDHPELTVEEAIQMVQDTA